MVAGRTEFQPWHRRAEQLAEEGADCITAGFPCQDISLAGAGAGLAGARSGLVWPLLRTIRLVRPAVALLENVAALLGRGLGSILGHLAEVGYDAEWHCIPASALGAPHQRDRVWIVATDADRELVRQQQIGELASEGPTFAREHGNARPVADANSEGELQSQGAVCEVRRRAGDCGHQPDVSDAQGVGRNTRRSRDAAQGAGRREPRGVGRLREIRDSNVSGLALGQGQSRDVGEKFTPALGTDWWGFEPEVGRVADGVPSRVDRLHCLGNAVVQIIPEWIATEGHMKGNMNG